MNQKQFLEKIQNAIGQAPSPLTRVGIHNQLTTLGLLPPPNLNQDNPITNLAWDLAKEKSNLHLKIFEALEYYKNGRGK